MNWEKCRKYFPPGYEGDKEIRAVVVWLAASVVYSFRFFFTYKDCYDLCVWKGGMTVDGVIIAPQIREGIMMPPFPEVLDNCMLGFGVAMVLLIIYGNLHYAYYFQESRSILLVRRLPDKWFVWRTCVAGPVLVAIMNLLIMGLLLLVYYGVYWFVTPAQCLP